MAWQNNGTTGGGGGGFGGGGGAKERKPGSGMLYGGSKSKYDQMSGDILTSKGLFWLSGQFREKGVSGLSQNGQGAVQEILRIMEAANLRLAVKVGDAKEERPQSGAPQNGGYQPQPQAGGFNFAGPPPQQMMQPPPQAWGPPPQHAQQPQMMQPQQAWGGHQHAPQQPQQSGHGPGYSATYKDEIPF